MMQFIKTNWPLIVLTILAAVIMGVIVDKKRNDLPRIREEMRLEKLKRSQERSATATNEVGSVHP
jgi:hypothetical protein